MCFPEFCEPFWLITESKDRVMGTLILNCLVRSTGDKLGLACGISIQGVEESSHVGLSP